MLDLATFYDRVRNSPFRGHLTDTQVSGMKAILLESPDDFRDDYLAYCFATTFHETATTMQPIEEYGKGRGRSYGVPTGPWHMVYDGRGDVQLTFETNYAKATRKLRAMGILTADEDLEKTPSLAMRPDIAAAILFVGMAEGWFTGKKLSDYFSDTKSDPINARRIINGTDKASLVATYYRSFLAAIRAAKAAGAAPVPAPTPEPVPFDPAPTPAPPPATVAPTPVPTPPPVVAHAAPWWERLFHF